MKDKLKNDIKSGVHTKELIDSLIKTLNEYADKSEELYLEDKLKELASIEDEFMDLFIDYLKEFHLGRNSEVIRALENIYATRDYVNDIMQ